MLLEEVLIRELLAVDRFATCALHGEVSCLRGPVGIPTVSDNRRDPVTWAKFVAVRRLKDRDLHCHG